VLYFHGNGGALRNRVDRFHALIADGSGLIALSYRGYGGSTGRPTEAGLIADAEAAYGFAAARYPAERIVLWGESLGSGVAVALFFRSVLLPKRAPVRMTFRAWECRHAKGNDRSCRMWLCR
jgi:fermentation-respiration switch protein FrsA (DUF1100 family)